MWPAGAGGILPSCSRVGGVGISNQAQVLQEGRPHCRISSYPLKPGPGGGLLSFRGWETE